MANKIPVLDEGQRGLNEMIQLLKEVQSEIIRTSQLMRQTPKNTFDVKTPREANTVLQQRAQITEQVSAALKEQDRLERALISTIEKNKAATESTNRALVQQRLETTQLNRVIKEEAILNSRITTEYQKLVIKMNQAGRSVQNLTAKKAQGIRLSNAEQKELKQSERDFKRYNRAVIKADVSIKRFQRNVGNYASGLGKAGFALRNFAGAFGVLSAAAIGREIFNLVKEIDGVNKALKQVTETQDNYNRAQEFTIRLSEEAGVEINGLQKSYTKFLASAKTTNLTLEETEDIFRQTAKAGAILGLSTDDINGTFKALEQILSKGKVQAEEIRGQLGERLPGAFQILAKSMGLTTQELSKQLELGNVISEEVLPGFARELEKTFGLDKVAKIETLAAAQNRLSNAWTAFIKSLDGSEGTITKIFTKTIDYLAGVLKGIRLLNLTAAGREGEMLANITSSSQLKEVDRLNENVKLFGRTLKEEAQRSKEDAEARLKSLKDRVAANDVLIESNKNLERGSSTLGNIKRVEKAAKDAAEANKDLNKQIAATQGILKASDGILNPESNKPSTEEFEDSDKKKAGKDPRGSEFNTKRAELEAIIAFNDDILKSEEASQEQRLLASLNYYDAQEDLLVLNRDLAITQAKGNVDKISDIQTKYNTDTLKNEQKREDASLKILEDSFNEKLKTIQDAQDEVAKSMQVEIDQQNRIFLASERTPEDIEKREKAIIEIRKRYAIEELRVALELTKALAEIETDPERKAKLLESAKALETQIIQLAADNAIGIAEDEAKRLAEIETIKQDAFKRTAQVLSDSLGLNEEKLNTLFESLGKNATALERVGAITAVVGDIASTVFDRQIQQYDEEIQANNDFYATKLDNENLSEEQRSALEAERERKNADLEKKKRKEQEKQAKLNKAFAAVQVIVNTAVGISKAIAASPLTGGLPFTAIVAALGAVQLAAVLAQPIPKYKHGRKGGDAEYAYVGDGGVNEVIERAYGGYEITPNRQTLTYLNKGDKVHPNADKFLQEQAYNMSLSAQGRTIERVQVNNNLTKKDLDSHAAQLVKAMSQNKANIRIHNDNRIGDELKFLNRLNDVL